MKYIIIFILFISIPISASRSFAGGIGGIGNASEVTQLANFGQLVGIQATDLLSLSKDIQEYVRTYTLEPLIKMLAANVLTQMQNQTLSWIRSGFQGAGPAFVVNPNAFFKNVANQAIEKELRNINTNTSNIFSKSVIGNVIQTVRSGRIPIGEGLTFTLSSNIQDSLCTEQNITTLATKAVDAGLTTNNNPLTRDERIRQKKQELQANLCSVNASADKVLSKNLASCFNTNFSCGGFSAWLDLTTNPNNTEFGQQIKAIQGIQDQAATKIQQTKDQMVNGLMPKTKCNVLMDKDDDGNLLPEDQQRCFDESIQTPAVAVVNSLQTAQASGAAQVSNTQGIGLSSILSALATGVLNRAISGFSSAVSSGINSSNIGELGIDAKGNPIITQLPGIPTSGTSGGNSNTGGNDISFGDVGGAPAIIALISKTSTTLNKLEATYTKSSDLFKSYETDLDALQTCLTTAQGKGYRDAGADLAYVNQTRGTYVPYYQDVKNKLLELPDLKKQTDAYKTSLEKDTSLSNISKVTNDFSKALTDSQLPNEAAVFIAENEYKQYQKQVSDDRNKYLNPKLQACKTYVDTSNGTLDPGHGNNGGLLDGSHG